MGPAGDLETGRRHADGEPADQRKQQAQLGGAGQLVDTVAPVEPGRAADPEQERRGRSHEEPRAPEAHPPQVLAGDALGAHEHVRTRQRLLWFGRQLRRHRHAGEVLSYEGQPQRGVGARRRREERRRPPLGDGAGPQAIGQDQEVDDRARRRLRALGQALFRDGVGVVKVATGAPVAGAGVAAQVIGVATVADPVMRGGREAPLAVQRIEGPVDQRPGKKMDDLEVRVPVDVRGGERVLERVHEHVGPGDSPLGEARIAQDPFEDRARHANTAEVRRRRQPARHPETRIDRREAVGGVRHEVLALPALAELAIEHQIRDPRTERRPVAKRQIETLGGAATAVGPGAIETGRRHQDSRGDEGRQERPSGDGRRPRPRNGGEREQPLVGGGFDDLVTIEPEGKSRDARSPSAMTTTRPMIHRRLPSESRRSLLTGH